MASGSNRDESIVFMNPSSISSPVAVAEGESYLLDSNSGYQIGSASGSFQNNEGFLDGSESDFAFSRPEFRQSPLVGTVETYDRHIFLCYKNPKVWPPRIEAAEFDRLPRLLSSALASRKPEMKKQTRLTICEGHDGTETSNGDVLIFPEMIRYRRLTHFDVETFVDEVLVKERDWLPGIPEALSGFYVFVCAHGSRDQRCGLCGPHVITRFKEEIESRGLHSKVTVSPCSHIGGHKYAGNVIIFGPNPDGKVTGHWYGYVTPDDVPFLLEHHIGRGEIVDYLWRGQMGLSEEDQKIAQESRLKQNSGGDTNGIDESESRTKSNGCQTNGSRVKCCQTNGTGTKMKECESDIGTSKKMCKYNTSDKRSSFARRACNMPTWLESWEWEDTYASMAVVAAVVSVAFAYGYYKRMT